MKPLRILIVEDESFWTEKIKSVLTEELGTGGYAVSFDLAKTAKDARSKIRDLGGEAYDLVSLDMHLANSDGQAGDGLSVLGTIALQSAAWMVSIFTGVERDDTVADSLGDELARKLQEELRSSVYKKTFPRDRMIIQEKPDQAEEALILTRLKDVCSILKHSLAGQNVFRSVELPCKTPMHELNDGSWVVKDSDEFKQAKKEKKVKMAGKYAKKAEWHDSTVRFREVRFQCGSLITMEDLTDYKVIAAALSRPGEKILATTMDGEEEGFAFSGSELAENQDTDFENPLGQRDGEWDDTEATSRAAYTKTLMQLKAQLETTDQDSAKYRSLTEQVEILEAEIAKLRKGRVAKVEKGTVAMGTAKSRVIGNLKKAGQLDLAEHLERFLIKKGQSLCYEPDMDVIWNT